MGDEMREESAGGIVFRRTQSTWEILLIQDRYGYWTFPKGKKEPNETDEQTALREIEEETQMKGNIIKKLDTTNYLYRHPVHGTKIQKTVTYFLVQATGGTIKPQEEEIDDVKWVTLKQADQLLAQSGYQNNQHVFQLAKRELKRKIT